MTSSIDKMQSGWGTEKKAVRGGQPQGSFHIKKLYKKKSKLNPKSKEENTKGKRRNKWNTKLTKKQIKSIVFNKIYKSN